MCDRQWSAQLRCDVDVLLLEYGHLKEEQRLRITSRDNLVYATLVAVAAVCGVAFQVGSLTLLLLLPAVGTVLGWTHLINDRKISQIGSHIGSDLAKRVAAGLAVTTEPFSWEVVHRTGRGYRLQKAIQTVVNLLTFCGPGLLAIAANLAVGHTSPSHTAFMIVGAASLLLLAQQMLATARPATGR